MGKVEKSVTVCFKKVFLYAQMQGSSDKIVKLAEPIHMNARFGMMASGVMTCRYYVVVLVPVCHVLDLLMLFLATHASIVNTSSRVYNITNYCNNNLHVMSQSGICQFLELDCLITHPNPEIPIMDGLLIHPKVKFILI